MANINERRMNLKVPESVWNWIKDEQTRVRKATGREPTQSDVLEQLIAFREQHEPRESISAFPSTRTGT